MVYHHYRKWKSKMREHFDGVIKTKTSSRSIALGFAIGTLISILPTPGMNLLIGLLIILIFKSISKISLIASIFFWNPLTLIPIYYLSYALGNALLPSPQTTVFDIQMFNLIYNFSRNYIIGNLIIATIFTVGSYYLIYHLVERYKKRPKHLQIWD